MLDFPTAESPTITYLNRWLYYLFLILIYIPSIKNWYIILLLLNSTLLPWRTQRWQYIVHVLHLCRIYCLHLMMWVDIFCECAPWSLFLLWLSPRLNVLYLLLQSVQNVGGNLQDLLTTENFILYSNLWWIICQACHLKGLVRNGWRVAIRTWNAFLI